MSRLRAPSTWVYGAILLVAVVVGVLPAVAADDVLDRRLRDERITESSGLAASSVHDGVLYTHNDSDDGPHVFAVDPDGRTAAVLTLRGAEARDWEAISPGRRGSRELWVGDIGDNRSSWPTVRAYRFEEPQRLRDQDVAWTQYDLRFEDGPRDAEALMVHPVTGRLYVVSKRASNAGVYVAPRRLSTTSVNVLRRVADAPGTVTDGAWSPDGRHYALRGYVRATLFDGERLGRKIRDVALPAQFQGESLAWTPDGTALLSGSEGRFSKVYRTEVRLDGADEAGEAGGDEAGDDDGVGGTDEADGAAGPALTSGPDDPADEPVLGDEAATDDPDTDDGRRGLVLLAIAAAAVVGIGVALRRF